jgi:hypothetical protein
VLEWLAIGYCKPTLTCSEMTMSRHTLLHVDSTLNTVTQNYVAFVIGFSDACGHYLGRPIFLVLFETKNEHF